MAAAANGGGSGDYVVVTAEDTDVLLLCLGMCNKFRCRMYQKCGTKARTRWLDITKLSNALERGVCNALIGMHAFTGCDTISAFAGRRRLQP